jgi:pimeloyl-ACP methyl ester carboxylesterase
MMPEQAHIEPADLYGLTRLAVDATLGVTDLVEALHHTISRAPGVLGTHEHTPMHGIPSLVYSSIRDITRLVGGGLGAVLAQFAPSVYEGRSSPERDAMLAALNGVVGDHLASSGNSLAIPMQLRRDAQALVLDAEALAAAIEQPSTKVLLMVHGLCLNDRQWRRHGHDHGALLAMDLGYTNIYLHYNTGLHISENGRAFAGLLESLLHSWPVPVQDLVIVGHSMGGLVARSACHYGALAGHAWLRQLSKIVFLGTPHHGSPMERAGHWLNGMLGLSPYTAAFERLGRLRSAGITDLRYGSLLDEDWAGRASLAPSSSPRRAVRLPVGVQCYCIGASTGRTAGDLCDRLLGDGLVLLDSALGYHASPSLALQFCEQWIGYDMNHMDLLDRRDVYEQLRQWLAEE